MPTAWIVEGRTSLSLPIPLERGVAQFLVVAGLSIGAAALSWTLIEHPINRHKSRFPYVAPATACPLPIAAEQAIVGNERQAQGHDPGQDTFRNRSRGRQGLTWGEHEPVAE